MKNKVKKCYEAITIETKNRIFLTEVVDWEVIDDRYEPIFRITEFDKEYKLIKQSSSIHRCEVEQICCEEVADYIIENLG